MRARIENMKELIRRRQAVPLKIPQDVLRQGGIIDGPAERKYRQTMIVDDGEIGRLRARAMSPTQRPRISSVLMSSCLNASANTDEPHGCSHSQIKSSEVSQSKA